MRYILVHLGSKMETYLNIACIESWAREYPENPLSFCRIKTTKESILVTETFNEITAAIKQASL